MAKQNEKVTAYATYEAGAPHQYGTCPGCGGTKTATAALCRKCRAEARAKRCPGCGVQIRKAQARCHDCYEKMLLETRPSCVDCGGPVKRYSAKKHAVRCWTCEAKRRDSTHGPICSVESCGRPHHAMGFCVNHYMLSRRTPVDRENRNSRRRPLMKLLAKLPCQICGYNRIPSVRHRIVEGAQGGTYTIENTVQVCRNCHGEIHAGLIAAPTPLTVAEILFTAAALNIG